MSRSRVNLMASLLLACMICLTRVASAETNGWVIETINNTPGSDVGAYATLAIDAFGNLHTAYYDSTHNGLLYSARSKGTKHWFTTEVDDHGRGSYVSLAVDSSGEPHLAYVSRYEDGLHYATWDGRKWRKQLIDREHINYYTGIALDKNNHPRISYYLYHAPDGSYLLHLKLASFDGNRWTIETVDKRRGTGKFNSLALDASGNPIIAYSHVSLGDLLYAAWHGASWEFGDADSRRVHNDYVGAGNSIAIDREGNPHIAYFDLTKALVKYAVRRNGEWKTEIIDRLVSQGEVDHVSLKLDSHERPHIAYYDAGMGILKYASRGADGWTSQVVDDNGNVGKYPSLCFDSGDTPYIAYYALDTASLMLAHMEAQKPVVAAEVK